MGRVRENFKLRYYVDGNPRNIQIKLDEVDAFSVCNYEDWKKDGSFKKWLKKGRVVLKDNTTFHNVPYWVIVELKAVIKAVGLKLNVIDRHEMMRYKNLMLRKAIDWIWSVV